MKLISSLVYLCPNMEGPFTISTILSQLYSYYSSLLKAVDQLASPCTILRDGDTEPYRRMCTTTLIASKKQAVFDSKNNTFGDPIQVLSMSDIIGKATEKVGSGGARLLKSSASAHFLNSNEFKTLHKRVGDEIVTFLLQDCTLFVSVGISNNYYQVTGIPIYNLFPSSTIPVQHDKLVRSAPKSPKWQTARHVRRRGRKRRVDPCDPPRHDSDKALPGKSPVLQDLPGNHDLLPAPKGSKIDPQPTEILSSHILRNTDVGRSHITKISSSRQEEIPVSHTADLGVIPVSHTADLGEIPVSHTADLGEIPVSHTADLGEFPVSHTTDQEEIPVSHTADQEQIPVSHIADRKEIRVAHVNDVEEISYLHVLKIADHNGNSSAVLDTSTESGSVPHASEDTTDFEHQHVTPSEHVLPGESSLPSRKRPHRQLEEIFEAAVLTRPKRRKRFHYIRSWREGKGGSRGRRWRRWRKEENRKKRWRHKQRCKKQKTCPENERKSLLSGLVQQQIPRFQMFYSPRQTQGFPKNYILNVIGTGNSGGRKLVKAAFEGKRAPPRKRSGRRRAADSRLSRRLMAIVPVFRQMIANHKKCRYHSILDHHCPLPQGVKEGETGQLSSHSRKEYKTLLTSSYTSHVQVHKFLASILSHVVPAEMWGSAENRGTFVTHLRMFVGLRRWESMSLRQMDQGIKLSQMGWVMCGNQFNLSAVPHIYKWLMWLMTNVVIATIKAFFYVTEHSDHHNHVFYYRKPVWERLCKLALEDRSGVFSPITEEEVEQKLVCRKTLGISKLRFLPKSSGARPIINLGSKVKLPLPLPGGMERQNSVNYQLQDVFHILTYEKDNRPETTGSTCCGFDEIYSQVRAFVLREKARGSEGEESRPLLFVRTDLANCFDSILSDNLYQILQHTVLSQDSYLLRKYTSVMLSKDRIKRVFHKAATKRVQCEPFHCFVSSLSQSTSLRDSILTDMVVYPIVNRSKILELLKKHLFRNVVKVGTQYLKQTQGIPQGSRLSTLLCGFYYGDMERKCLPNVGLQNGLLMRFVDDFLLITREPEIARKFFTTMTAGIPEYNCSVSPGKTATNFELLEDGTLRVLKEVQWVGWCGLMFNTQTLDINYDYSRYTKKCIRDNMTIVRHSKPFHNLFRITREAVRLRCLPILLDCEMLSVKVVMINIYQGFLLAAVKFVANVKALSLGNRCRKYTKFFYQIVVESVQHFYNVARRKLTLALLPRFLQSSRQTLGWNAWRADTGRSRFTISWLACTWLGCRAFHAILKRKDHRKHLHFKMLVSMIACKITTLSNKMGMLEIKHCLRATLLARSKSLFTIRC